MPETLLTIPQLAAKLGQPDWLVRRVVDSLPAPVPRAGLYRLVPASRLDEIARAIEQRRKDAAEASA